ncbi:MAG TPA: PRC-barrel domain-containing protein [Vineibacter sp.]|nr:PRC-barrel domain-containing protein [Vineibacter sp.]
MPAKNQTRDVIKTAAVAAVMVGLVSATPVLAQTPPAQPAPSAQSGQVDAKKLIGQSVVNAQNERVGEIESVIIDADGKVRTAIMDVGGFLGMGEHRIAVAFNRLAVSDDGKKVTISATKDELKALPAYTYTEPQQRRTVFSERTPSGTVTPRTETVPRTDPPPATSADRATPRTSPTATPPATTGKTAMETQVSAKALMGLNIRNSANETIGEIEDVVLAADGKIQDVIVGVGGFLGLGERHVAIAWKDLRVGSGPNNALVAEVNATKDQLKAMPAFKRENGVWIAARPQ